MAERKGDTKDTLLYELESIKGLLDDEDAIPVLREVIESIEPLDGNQPRQPSLFQPSTAPEKGTKAARRASNVTRASGENPFLPAHIRARLHGNRPPPNWDQPAPDPTPPGPSAVTEGPDAGDPASLPTPQEMIGRQQLIEQLVQECLPDMEARLRQRLHEASDTQLQYWLDHPADD
ncbi:hypothetical protein [Marinimicrobium agarilyticum]|uniref:hypothetical protein n=1 Tax=Marinimicrobium agarilyticum TaxID=306546 RepID=UPI00042A57D1|nr:hypothetical protein [Marinimicrobium agarilyticum]